MISWKNTKNCLLVDDDKDDQDIFRYALNNVHPEFSCVFAEDGDTAIHLLQDKTMMPDFIVMDINLPRLNGLDCLAAIKKIHELQSIPIFMYSTCGQNEIVDKCITLGASGFYTKTSNIMDLENSLKAIVSQLYVPEKRFA